VSYDEGVWGDSNALHRFPYSLCAHHSAVAMQNVVQVFYMLALFGSAVACILFFAKAIYMYTCKAKDI
jgi:hypothetical protein